MVLSVVILFLEVLCSRTVFQRHQAPRLSSVASLSASQNVTQLRGSLPPALDPSGVTINASARTKTPAMNKAALDWARRCFGSAADVSGFGTIADTGQVDQKQQESMGREELESHYASVLVATQPLRGHRPHGWAGGGEDYFGPWIEERWIEEFCCNKSFEAFAPFVPLFVQWMAITDADPRRANWIHKTLLQVMDPRVIYITVSMNDNGILYSLDGQRVQSYKNILVLSGGGVGHVPVPLLKQEESTATRPVTDAMMLDGHPPLVAFVGTDNSLRPARHTTLQFFTSTHQQRLLMTGDTRNSWEAARFALTPRGMGRAAFSTYEALQRGNIPVYVWDDFEWLPYRGSFQWRSFRATNASLTEMVDELSSVPKVQILQVRARIRSTRESHWTYAGVMKQIGALLAWNGNSDLRCYGAAHDIPGSVP